MTAASQVFAIPELLENVLTHADTRTLLRCQSVNKLFYDMTLTRKPLRKNLYLDAVEGSGQVQGHDSEPRPVVNPLFETFRNLDPEVESYLGKAKWTISFYGPLPEDRCKAALAEGSWRNMLVSQSPSSVALWMKSPGHYGREGPYMQLIAKVPGPVTMRKVVDKFRDGGVLIR